VGTDAGVGNLGNDGVASGTKGELERQVDEDHHGSDSNGRRAAEVGDDADDTDDELPESDGGETIKVEEAASVPSDQEDGDTGCEDVGRLDGHRVVESHGLGHPSVPEEDGSVRADTLTGPHLDGEDDAGDLCPAEVDASEAVHI
jgi:hypothetical protein